jgi:nucleoside-diphosphate-sugar epimerase
VNHAIHYPKAERPAQLRGRGEMIRDYVPVGYVAQVLMAVSKLTLDPGTSVSLNVGTGRGMTNRQIAEAVSEALAAEGLRLDAVYSDEPGPGEARFVVLDMNATAEVTGLQPPGPEEVRASLQESVRTHLESACVS